jgi:hypothetical protein
MSSQLHTNRMPGSVPATDAAASAELASAPDSSPRRVEADSSGASAEVPVLDIPACGVLCDVFWWARRSR